MQGGGLGIYGDFIVGNLKNEYGGGKWDSIMGPTAGDISKIIGIVENVNKPQKAGKKLIMNMIWYVEVPQEAFMAVLSLNETKRN